MLKSNSILIAGEYLRLDVTPRFVRLVAVGFVLKRKKRLSLRMDLNTSREQSFPSIRKWKPPVPDVTFTGPFVCQKGRIILRIVDIEDIPLIGPEKTDFGSNGKVAQAFEMYFLIRRKGRALMALEKNVTFFSPIFYPLSLGGDKRPVRPSPVCRDPFQKNKIPRSERKRAPLRLMEPVIFLLRRYGSRSSSGWHSLSGRSPSL